MEILRAGGSAVDASMAMMLALTVVEPQSSGIGGGGFLLYHDGASKRLSSIDGRETAPASAGADRFLGLPFRAAAPGGLSVGVPGNVALMAKAHGKWGKLPWARLFAPAITLARDGFVVNQRLADALARMAPLWKDFPDARALYWRDGKPVEAGTTLTNPALAHFLEELAARGPSAFYTGDNADAIGNAVAKSSINPAAITLSDIAGYEAKDRPPVCAPYRVYKLCGMGPPSSGATTVFQILGMLERFDMRKLGKDNVVSWHLISEAMRLAYADRETYLGDSDFVDVPVKGLLDRRYVRRRSALLSTKRTLGEYVAGSPPAAPRRTAALPHDVPGTTHFVAIDGAGSIATMTSTVEGPFGSQLVANGYFLNNELTDFAFTPEKNGAPVANRVQPGKRPLSSMSPTIVYDAKGNPIFTVGAAGGKTIIMQVAKALIARLDWGLSAEDSIALGLVYFKDDTLLIEKGTHIETMRGALEDLGHVVEVAPMNLKANAAALGADGWIGGADPRSHGVALRQ
jgi:gamma-glutamyltranspeptidase / glutathione hydrolase